MQQLRKELSWPGFHTSRHQHACYLTAGAHAFVSLRGFISPSSENLTRCVPTSTVSAAFPGSLWAASGGSGSLVPSAVLAASSPGTGLLQTERWPAHLLKTPNSVDSWVSISSEAPEVALGAKMQLSRSSSCLTNRKFYVCCLSWYSLLALCPCW